MSLTGMLRMLSNWRKTGWPKGTLLIFRYTFLSFSLAQLTTLYSQDLVSRFTLDSATEFLFRNDVCSLAAGLPYPAHPSPLAKANSSIFEEHPSNTFVKAFIKAQDHVALRGRSGTFWVLKEIWGDAVAPFRKEIDHFVEPFVQEGMSRKEMRAKDSKAGGDQTLLDYLVHQTPGVLSPHMFRNIAHIITDREVIKDEVR